MKSRHPEVRLVGFGTKRPRLPLPYDEFFENPPQERLAWLYSRCPIYCCPSWDEGLGMPAMEAMACGAALCTYDNGGCRDYAIDGRTALVAPRRDVAGPDRGARSARGGSAVAPATRAAGARAHRLLDSTGSRRRCDSKPCSRRGRERLRRAVARGPARHDLAEGLLLEQALGLERLEDVIPATPPRHVEHFLHGPGLLLHPLRGASQGRTSGGLSVAERERDALIRPGAARRKSGRGCRRCLQTRSGLETTSRQLGECGIHGPLPGKSDATCRQHDNPRQG